LATTQTVSTSTRDHELCAIGVYTHNLAGPASTHASELSTVLKVLENMQYVRAEDREQIAVLEKSWPRVVYAPLQLAPVPPDVVLVFARSSQGLVIAEAVQQVESGAAPAMGRPACAIIPQVVNTGKAALSLGCCGARAYLGILTDEIALWGFPGNRIDQYVDRIEGMARANDVLTKFHSLRLADVQSGRKPTYEESLARMA
jgi:uncharacterized protein (DUF169 family)